MTKNPATVVVRGLALPPVLGVQLAVYCDRGPGFGAAGPMVIWHDSWRAGRVQTLGADLLGLRFRLVLERLAPGAITEWGLI